MFNVSIVLRRTAKDRSNTYYAKEKKEDKGDDLYEDVSFEEESGRKNS